MAGLVHEGAAVQVPAAAPGGGVVIALRAGPEDIDRAQKDAAEAALINRLLDELDCGVEPVLLDDEELDAGIAAGTNHRDALIELGGHRLFAQYMAADSGHGDRLLGMQSAGRGKHHDVRRRSGQQRIERGKSRCAGRGNGGLQGLGPRVANCHPLGMFAMLGQGLDMVLRDAATADQGEADFSIADGQVLRLGLTHGAH